MTLNKFLYKVLSFINRIIPKKNNVITIYGRKKLNNNTNAILDYLIDNDYTQKYKIYIVIEKNVWHESYCNIKNVYIIFNALRSLWIIFRSKYIFNAQGMGFATMRPAKDQIIFNIWHGSALKKIGRLIGHNIFEDSFSYFLSASPLFEEINIRCFGHSVQQSFIGSNPRNDLLFKKINLSELFDNEKSDINIMFMPTFRNSKTLNYEYNGISFPLITDENISEINGFLKQNRVTLFIKPHPYQESIPWFCNKYSNIIIVTDNDLHNKNIPLYSLLGNCDGLLTDFSSVYFDYLLLDKPIGFLIEDIADYKTNRGFTLENPLDYMPGMKIQNLSDFRTFIKSVIYGDDSYKLERNRVNGICNSYQTPDACKRILDYIGVAK